MWAAQVGVGYSMWRAWWEQRLGEGKINNSVCSWSLRCREGRAGSQILECQAGEFAFWPVDLGSPREHKSS